MISSLVIQTEDGTHYNQKAIVLLASAANEGSEKIDSLTL